MSKREKQISLVEDIVRVKRAQKRLPRDRDLAAVRANLEDMVGATVSQRVAATALGVSHTAIQRWVSAGDVETVLTPSGRHQIPTATVVSLLERMTTQNAKGSSTHVLEPSMIEARRETESLRARVAAHAPAADQDPHEIAAWNSLALHREVARRLNPEIIDEALYRVWKLRSSGRLNERYASEWESLLTGPVDHLRREIVVDDQHARDLRQNSPFSGLVSSRERDVIHGKI